MSIAAYIKIIGRGKDGARSLGVDEARDLFEQVLDAKVTDLEIGAFCLAMRIKGESVEELDGFVQATHARCIDLSEAIGVAPKGIVVLPSYNGARKLPNLTALLALELARQGVGVLVHGPSIDPTRVTTAQVFTAAGLPVVQSATELAAAWQAGLPAFMDIADLCPAMDKLLAVRWTIGLRNPGHSVAKLLDPFTLSHGHVPSVRVVNHTHPEYAHSLRAYLQHARANAMLMRGTEGEPVADARRQPKCDVFIGGEHDEARSLSPVEGVLTTLPDLPVSHAAADTAQYIAQVREGAQPLPPAIQSQAQALVQALARVTEAATV
ncbi:MAG: DNA-binding protein YbiB [Aquabacterium sp.]|uniref:DNA-binding protein YbiB n=1 Tax=Aquabacterium sp. TaxID=1872578 RepID=UPI0025C72AE7|nr:DNA-binding protein YbiB [Aquabacterium sp.]MBI3383136.1 DNA-binding protein YbiB [Aquabacterium sp.]